MKRLIKKAEFVQEFPIDNLKNRRGQIGDQGVDSEGIYNLLVNICKMNISQGSDIVTMIEMFKNDQNTTMLLQQFCQSNPIEVTKLPEDYYSLKDGHHRTFLMDQAGFKTIPANVN